jgi:chorismate dehydratase
VGAVSYLNTKPLIYGFEQGMLASQMDLVMDYPANIANMLLNNEIDVGLVPVAIIPELNDHDIISDYCIGCNGAVASVCLFSDVPLDEIENVLLDYQSKTSVALLKILLKEHWKISPNFIPATMGFEKDIIGSRAGLVIGDRAFTQRHRSKYIFDLGAAWKTMTGLPFIFAAWVSNKDLPIEFIDSFNDAIAEGIEHINDIALIHNCDQYDLLHYYKNNIDFMIDAPKLKGLNLFLKKMATGEAV